MKKLTIFQDGLRAEFESAKAEGNQIRWGVKLKPDDRKHFFNTLEIKAIVDLRRDKLSTYKTRMLLDCTLTEINSWDGQGLLPHAFKQVIQVGGKSTEARFWIKPEVLAVQSVLADWRKMHDLKKKFNKKQSPLGIVGAKRKTKNKIKAVGDTKKHKEAICFKFPIKTNALISHLVNSAEEKNLFVSMPLIGWAFGDDNIAQLPKAVAELAMATPIIISSFSDIKSTVPFKNDSSKFLPMKLIISGLIDSKNSSFMSASEAREIFETCYKTGKKLPSIKDYSYVEPVRLLGDLVK